MSITVKFTGICTHVTMPGQTGSRVILVNAENGAYLNRERIPPHVPTLSIPRTHIVRMEGGMRLDGRPHGLDPTGEEGVWRLAGVRLELEDTRSPDYHCESTFESIPKLRTADDLAPLPELSPEVVFKEQAACYFEIGNGVMTSDETLHGARYAILNVETGDAPVLRATCFWNREWTRIHLRPGATIEVLHVGREHGDSDSDYLLHYRILTMVPEDAVVPKKGKGAKKKHPGDISIGCSNSQYP